jgi:hypothetical protein
VLEVIRRREGKPSKLLGRNYLLIIFDDVKNKLLADEIVVGMWLDKIGAALQTFFTSLAHVIIHGTEPKGLTKAYLDGFEHELRNPDSFVWAADMVTAIHKDSMSPSRRPAPYRASGLVGGDTLCRVTPPADTRF